MRDCQVLAGGSNSANLRTFKDYTIIYLRVALLIVMAFVRFMNLSASMMFGFFSLKDKTVGFSGNVFNRISKVEYVVGLN